MAGNIKIIEPTSKFVKVSRGIIRDNSVDVLTLGLYVKILVLGKDWELNIAGLGNIFNISEKKVRASINKLEALGYIRRVACRDASNKVLKGWDYYVYFEPVADELKTHAGYQSPLKTDKTETSVVGNQTCHKSDKTENGEDIYKDLNENKDLYINKDLNKRKSIESAPAKIEYAPKVFLTENEHAKLVMHYGTEGTDAMVQKLSIHKGANGKSYKSDYLAILNWVVDWYQRQSKNPLPNSATPSPAGRKTSTFEHNLNTLAQLGINPVQGTEADFDF